MAGRIRTIKPELLEDEKAAGLSDAAFRLFISLILLADDYGNVRGDVRWILGQVWWARGDSPRVAEVLGELRRVSLVTAYEVRGQSYLHIRGWERHQRIDNAGKGRVPSHKDQDAIEIPITSVDSRGDSPRVSANLGGLPLDLRPPTSDHDPERDHEGEREGKNSAAGAAVSASPPARRRPSLKSLPSPVEKAAAMAVLKRLGEYTKTEYRGGDAHTRLIMALYRSGLDETDLRKVIGYCARPEAEGGMGWADNARMRKYLRPETLFGPENIEKYLDHARSWFANNYDNTLESSAEYKAWLSTRSAA